MKMKTIGRRTIAQMPVAKLKERVEEHGVLMCINKDNEDDYCYFVEMGHIYSFDVLRKGDLNDMNNKKFFSMIEDRQFMVLAQARRGLSELTEIGVFVAKDWISYEKLLEITKG